MAVAKKITKLKKKVRLMVNRKPKVNKKPKVRKPGSRLKPVGRKLEKVTVIFFMVLLALTAAASFVVSYMAYDKSISPAPTTGSTTLTLPGQGLAGIPGNPGRSGFPNKLDSWLRITQHSKLVGTVNDGLSNQGFSSVVSRDGSTIFVGGPNDGGRGAVWVYKLDGNVWKQDGYKIVPFSSSSAAKFGYSIDCSRDGSSVIIGGPGDDNNMGAAWIFDRLNGQWTPAGSKHLGMGVSGIVNQGSSVAMSGDGKTIIICGEGDNNYNGTCWVFRKQNGVWVQKTQVYPSVPVGAGSHFGSSVCVNEDGTRFFVGAKNDNSDQGAVYTFVKNGANWIETHKIIHSETNDVGANLFGSSVATNKDGTVLSVGAPKDGAIFDGSMWIYELSDSKWLETGTALFAKNIHGGSSNTGYSCAMNDEGTLIVASAPCDNTDQGSLVIFGKYGSDWNQIGYKFRGVGADTTSKQGSSVSMSGSGEFILSGAPYDNGGLGASFVFKV